MPPTLPKADLLLVYCYMLVGAFSESLAGQTAPAHPCAHGICASMHIMQGAYRREWRALSKKRNAADGRPAARPKGAPQKRHDGVTALDKGMTIACALRLVLTFLGGSESIAKHATVH
ncbi:hypothetical protein SAMN03097708_01529 [Thiohalomonas denitrificans]|uniref:Uncharacterized protein n=1 Tax=Thiohalomonas denitrificans TaxID=415747 RepID=A0A1G5Q903_9GAMM|nr:hypothetical protein SAMN03097708_01529 [Thiohalomonas denitrificans]